MTKAIPCPLYIDNHCMIFSFRDIYSKGFVSRHLHANVLTLKCIVFMNVHRPSLQFISTIYYVDDSRCTSIKLVLKPVCSKKQQKSSWPVTCLQNRGLLKDLNDSKLCIWAQVIPLIIQDQFHTVQNIQRSPISHTSSWSGTFLAVSYSKPALVS